MNKNLFLNPFQPLYSSMKNHCVFFTNMAMSLHIFHVYLHLLMLHFFVHGSRPQQDILFLFQIQLITMSILTDKLRFSKFLISNEKSIFEDVVFLGFSVSQMKLNRCNVCKLKNHKNVKNAIGIHNKKIDIKKVACLENINSHLTLN